jgi:hypothetical protein
MPSAASMSPSTSRVCFSLLGIVAALFAIRLLVNRQRRAHYWSNESEYADGLSSEQQSCCHDRRHYAGHYHSKHRPVTHPTASLHVPTCESHLHDLSAAVQLAVNTNEMEAALLVLADAYARGSYPLFRPDEALAAECYRIVKRSANHVTAATAAAKHNGMKNYPLKGIDRSGDAMPRQYGIEACAAANRHLATQRPWIEPDERTPPAAVAAAPARNHYNHDQIIAGAAAAAAAEQRAGIQPVLLFGQHEVPVPQNFHDLQNAHDTAVVAAVTASVADLKSGDTDAAAARSNNVTQDVIDALSFSPDLTPNELRDATRVLQTLNSDQHGTFKTSETTALAMVWNRLQQFEDPVQRTNMIELMGKQLATGVERNNVVCSTGRITRIIGALDGTPAGNPAQRIRPLEAVKEELATLAAQVRTDHVARLTEQEMRQYDAGQLPAATDLMKVAFAEKAKEIYVDELKMHDTVVDPLVQVYSEGF